MNSIESILSNLAFWIIVINFFYWCVMEQMCDFKRIAYAHARGASMIIAILIFVVIG